MHEAKTRLKKLNPRQSQHFGCNIYIAYMDSFQVPIF